MVARQATVYSVADEGDFERASEFIRRRSGSRVRIEVAPDALVANSADAMQELAGSARKGGVDLEIAADDPLIRELARIYGVRLSGEPDAPTRPIRNANHDQTTVVTRQEAPENQVTGAETSPFTLPAAPEWGTDDIDQPDQQTSIALDDDASFSFVIAPPVPRRPDAPATVPQPSPDTGGGRRKVERRTRHRSGVLIAAFAALATVAAFAALLVGMLAPFATVTLTPAMTSVSTELTYGLVGGSTPLDLTFEPVTLTKTLTFTESIQTTGERLEPDASARGVVFVTNSRTVEAVIPAGTYLPSSIEGIGFLTEEEVIIPPADPFGAATFGTAVVNVVASEPGPDFNIGTGELSGEIDSGLLYRNRFPIEGGTLKSVAVVTEADIEQLRAMAETSLTGQAETALDGQLGGGLEIVPGTLGASAIDMTFSHRPGDDADSLQVEATLTVTGQAYDPDEMHQTARQELGERLNQSAPDGYAILEDRVQFSAPETLPGDGPPVFRLNGGAAAEAVIDPEVVDRLREDLIGRDRQEADAIVSAVPGIERYEIIYGPDWLPIEPVPRLETRVSVEVDAVRP